MKTEFGKVEEPVAPGTVGSPIMAQKRNPKRGQDIIAAAAEIRSIVPLAVQAMQTEHEAERTVAGEKPARLTRGRAGDAGAFNDGRGDPASGEDIGDRAADRATTASRHMHQMIFRARKSAICAGL